MNRARSAWLLAVLWSIVYTAAAMLLAWSRDGVLHWLVASAALTALGVLAFSRLHRHITVRTHVTAAFVLLSLGTISAAVLAWQLYRLGTDWELLQAQRTESIRQALDRRLAPVLEHGQRVVAEAARIPQDTARREWFDQLAQLQIRSKVDALAFFGEQGELLAWAGDHRGRFPNDVRSAPPRVRFIERPLYSYLYHSAALEYPTARGQRTGRAVVAILLDAALPTGAENRSLAGQIDVLAGRNASFLPGPGPATDWNLVAGPDTVLHARLDPVTQTEWRYDLLRLAQRMVVLSAGIAVLLLTLGWFREPVRSIPGLALLPLVGLVAAVFAAPLGFALGLPELFSPGLFLFPGPGDISLGSLLAVLLVSGVFVSTMRDNWRPRSPFWFLLAAALFTLALPIAIITLIGPTPETWKQFQAWTPTLMQGGPALWAALQLALTLLVAQLAILVLMTARLPARLRLPHRQQASYILLGASVAVAATFALVVLGLGRTREQITPLLSLLWFVPVLLAGAGTAAYQRDGRRVIRWLIAGWVAGTAILPYVWTAQVYERLETAGRDLATLGNKPDPYLEFLLRQFGREAIARRERGEDGLQLLYRSWVSSGMAREAHPARITIWGEGGRPEVLLALGDAFNTLTAQPETVPQYLSETFVRVQEQGHPEVFSAHDVGDVNQVLVVPLDVGRVITVEVPPRRTLERATAIAPVLGATTDRSTRLELVRKRTASSGEPWRPIEEGWRSEIVTHFPDGDYHAHLTLRLPGLGVAVARGLLILTADLLVMLALWLAGRTIRAEQVMPRGGWLGWLASFRVRVTAALFCFFLLPTVTFGLVAYRALAQEVTRAARTVAERGVEQAVAEFPDANGDLRELAAHAGAEVLLYFQGELQTVSSPEALELGVYNALMPADVFLALESGEEEADTAPMRIGNEEFISAFRRLQVTGTGTMAVPVSLQSGETLQRQREMAHLVLFAALVGGLLSLALSVAVGRALAGPIGRLQRAAAAVGAGRLRVQLPEQTGDEFGQLFGSFNRMVRRLQRARAQEVRTARVLAWGEMARQVAHEIKNPLTPIKLAVQHLRRAFADRRGDFEQVLDRNVDQILVEIDRLSDIARAFSRYGAPPQSAGPLEAVAVSAAVHEALTLYRAGDSRLEYVDDIEPGLPHALARYGELKEVILNLLENARAATEPPGRIAIRASRVADVIELLVEDNGAGISPDQLPRIFEPHFSTRTTGTGLGLAIVRRLVESWGGTVDAESETGRGTTIRVRLALADSKTPNGSAGN